MKIFRGVQRHHYVLLFIALVLFAIPNILWGNQYQVGGDDTKMYYLLPRELATHYSTSIITQNRLGTYSVYASPAFLTPFYGVMWLIHLIPVNTQHFAYGLNIAFGFLCCYAFLGLYLKETSFTGRFAKVIAALLYVLSNFLISTLYAHELMSIYAVSLGPFVLYLFIISVRKNATLFTLLSVLVYSLATATLITLPWYGAFFFSTIPLLLIEWKRNPRVFVRQLVLAAATFLLLNCYWILHMVMTQLMSSASSASISFSSLGDVARTNVNYIQAISQLNTILAQLFQQERTGWGIPIYFSPFNMIYLLPVLLAGILPWNVKDEGVKQIYILVLVSFLFTIILFTPNIDSWSLQLFLFLNAHIPMFAMFRTAYDKFSLALAFQYALILAFSLVIIGSHWKKLMVALSLCMVAVSLFSARSYIFPQREQGPISFEISGELNDDFTSLTDFMKSMNTGAHFVWLPLNFPSYIYIEDKRSPNHFYSGPSLITPLTDKIDYTGELSFTAPLRPGVSSLIIKHLKAKEYDAVGKIFQEFGIRYLILNKEHIPQKAKDYRSWLWGNAKWDELQKPEFIESMKGRLIKQFGERYELYEINPKYSTDVLYMADSISEGVPDTSLTYRKTNEAEFELTVTHLSKKRFLMFLEPYYKDWTIYLPDKNGKYTIPYKKGKNVPIFETSNSWSIDPNELIQIVPQSSGFKRNPDNSITFSAKIIFEPIRYSKIGNTISILGYVGVTTSIVWLYWRKKKATI